MKNSFKIIIVKLLLFSIFFYLLHYIFYQIINLDQILLFKVHLLFFIINLVLLFNVIFISKRAIDKTGFVFIGFFFIKIIIILVFLNELRQTKTISKTLVANLVFVYIIHLFYSIKMCLDVLKIRLKK